MIRRCGSIREAARQIHVDSSAVNRQLLQLEAEIGHPLFERLSSGMRLTAAGELFARHVINVLQDEQRFVGELDALKGVRKGHVRVIAADGLSGEFLPRVLGTMHSTYPLIRIDVERSGAAEAMRAVASGDADVAMYFGAERHVEVEEFASGKFQLGALVNRQHPLAKKKQVTLAECAKFPLLMPTGEVSTHPVLEKAIRNMKRPVEIAMRVGSMGLTYSLAVQGVGIAIATRIGIEREPQLVLVPFHSSARMFTDLGIYTRSKQSRSPAIDAFLRIAGAELERRLAEEEG